MELRSGFRKGFSEDVEGKLKPEVGVSRATKGNESVSVWVWYGAGGLGGGSNTECFQQERKHVSIPELRNGKKSRMAGMEGGREKVAGNEFGARLWCIPCSILDVAHIPSNS